MLIGSPYKSYNTVVLVPPKPFLTETQFPIVDWMAVGKWTVTPEHPWSILLNWVTLDPKLDVVRAGNLSEVRPVQLRKAALRATLPVKLVRAGKFTEVRLVQP